MRLLFVHERWGALGGAEANILVTADELRQRGHTVALACGERTGRDEAVWHETFGERFSLETQPSGPALRQAIAHFSPDVIFAHKMGDASVLRALADSDRPVVRMV